MEQVASNTYTLGSRSHNFYVMEDGGEVTVIDAGCSREWSKFVDALDSLGIALDSVSAILATHVHGDHFGFGAAAQDEGIEVSVHEDDETRALGTYTGRFAATAFDLPLWSLRAWRNMLPMLLAGVTDLDHVDQVGTFADGDVLDIPGRPRAVHTPGHTEGHTMFHCADDGLLFTGDGLVTMDLLGKETGPQMMSPVFNLDTEQAYDSLQRITELDAELLLPGHGKPWAVSPKTAVQKVLTTRT